MGSVDMHNHLLKTIQNIKVKFTEAEWRICALADYAIGSNNGQSLFGARLILETMLSYCTYDTQEQTLVHLIQNTKRCTKKLLFRLQYTYCRPFHRVV